MGTPPSLRRSAVFCLVTAPLLLTLADVLQLIDQTSLGWTIVMWVSFVLFIPVCLALTHLLRPHMPKLALAAGAAGVVGLMNGAAMHGFFRTVLTVGKLDLDPAVTATVQASLWKNLPLLLATFPLNLFFLLSLLLFSAALGRTRLVPRPAALLLALGTLLFPVGHAIGFRPALIGSDLVLLGALGWIASVVHARPELWNGGSTWSKPAGE